MIVQLINKQTCWYSKIPIYLLHLFIILLIISVIVDPSNLIFGVKYILFGLIFIIWGLKLKIKELEFPKNMLHILLFISFVIPLYALSIGLIRSYLNNKELGEILYINSFFFFLLVMIVCSENVKLTKIFNYSLLAIVFITLCSYLIFLIYPEVFGLLYNYFVENKNVAVFAFRNYGDFNILMMFYKTSPLLVFPLTYYLHQVLIIKNRQHLIPKIIFLFSIILTLIISGTRANLLALTFIIIFYLGYYAYKNSKKAFVLFTILFALLSIYAILFIWNTFLDSNELSNQIKLGHLISYFDHFSKNYSILIFGQGAGGSFYSEGFHSLTNVTELSYFEFLRIWGLPLMLMFIYVLLLPLIKTKKITSISIAYFCYLLIAGTNPLLLSSTGMIVLVYVFSEMFNDSSFKLLASVE